MLTKEQIKQLPLGFHSNTKLSKMFETHCKPLVGRRQFTFQTKDVPGVKEPVVISVIKNRRQRRSK